MSDFTAGSDEQSQEERIEWLRARGVEVDIKDKSKLAKKKDPANTRVVKIVKIPCDERKPYEEVSIPVDDDATGDQLQTLLRVYFSSSDGNMDMDIIRETAKKQFGSDSVAVREDTLRSLGREGSVEVFPLAHPCGQNGHQKVSFYLDEIGQLKHLAPNPRATTLAQVCGFDNVPLVGDMFIARVEYQPGSPMRNIDFLVDDLDSSAGWLRNIKTLNYEHGLVTGRVAMTGGGAEELPQGEDESKGYKWSETDETVELTVKLPLGTTKKEVAVKFHSKSLEITVKSAATSSIQEILKIDPLKGSIDVDDSTWTFTATPAASPERQPELDITLAKQTRSTWGGVEK